MKLSHIIIAAGLSLPIMAASIVASAEPLTAPPTSQPASSRHALNTRKDLPPPTGNASVSSCVVDVSDWPLGILPDDASAAFGPTVLAACLEAVADWPVGALPDDPSTLFAAVKATR